MKGDHKNATIGQMGELNVDGPQPGASELTQQDMLLPGVQAAYDRNHQEGAKLFKEGKPAEALQAYDRAIVLVGEQGEKHAAWAIADKGDALLQLGRTKEAVVALERATELLPEEDQEWVLASLGTGYERLAKDALQKVQKINPKNDMAESRLRKLGGGDEETKTTTEISATPEVGEKLSPLEIYIRQGLDLLKEGKGEEAQIHFFNLNKSRELGLIIDRGRIVNVPNLLTEADLIIAARNVAVESRTSGGAVLIGNPLVNIEGTQGTAYSEKYDPALVQKLDYEVGLLCAEEWLHVAQYQKAKSTIHTAPLAGEDDPEVDVLAYFDRYGMSLSPDFITRYGRRADWYVQQHPDREEEIRTFEKKYPGI